MVHKKFYRVILILIAAILSEVSAKGAEPLPADTIAGSDAPEVKEFDRDIESVVFIPKGQWITGVNISYTQSNQNDYQFLIFQGISGDTYSFKVSPMLIMPLRQILHLVDDSLMPDSLQNWRKLTLCLIQRRNTTWIISTG